MTTRLILCFDGTWNSPGEDPGASTAVETNVVRFHESVRSGALPSGSTQTKWYDDGVGTDWYDKISGGAFGFGLDQKIRDGYKFLVETYPNPDPGDREVYILGFSRGAYTARSLVGMIRNVGLLLPENVDRVDDAYALYRTRDAGADTDEATAFRARYSRSIAIKFLGVWDTVGALGIPVSALEWLNSAIYSFHDTELSGIVQNAAHAVAIDEHRIDYQVTLWQQIAKTGQSVEQRWFIGAHADVGGGYPSRDLSDITLNWMQAKAKAVGLELDPAEEPVISAKNWQGAATDSYHAFLNGAYALAHEPFYRPLDLAADDQTMDIEVQNRARQDPTYRPQNSGFPLPPAAPAEA
ncbi:MAG TPA: DUF2235 domain-containing protein [Stellaceae bacterium]|jgi:uncharacterized protein (DUF2235 family)